MEKVVQVTQNPILNTPPIIPGVPKLKPFPKNRKNLIILYVALAIIAGIPSGFLMSKVTYSASDSNTTDAPVAKTENKNGKQEMGISDESTFKDTAEGVLEEGGIDGEGTYHLVRPGGDSQNVYLTSTVIDLASFMGKKVQVWGQTLSARKAGWLMDVGKIKLLE